MGHGYHVKEVRGVLEIFDGFIVQTRAGGNNVVAPKPLPDLPLITPGRMSIRLMEDEHY